MVRVFIVFIVFSIIIMTSALESDQNEYVLNLRNNQREHMKKLALSLRSCQVNLGLSRMKLRLLRNQSTTCNDGTRAGYYIRQSRGSKRWLVFLQGGTYCFDQSSCNRRCENSPKLTGSSMWPKTERGTGILSPDPVENPIWWNSNVVMIPYCSSDVWSGTSSTTDTGYAFMGSLIIKEVLRELLAVGLLNSKQLVLSGSSAGGTGVILNLDSIRDWLISAGSKVQVRGLVDSGWFLDMDQLKETTCDDSSIFCKPSEAISKGVTLWGSSVPSSCLSVYGTGNEWKCFFGVRTYETLTTPIYIVQWLYDEAQLTVNLVTLTPPTKLEEWNYMQKTAREMRASLKNVSAVFAPSCYGHMILESREWTKLEIRNINLHKSIKCWLEDSNESNTPHQHRPSSSTSTTTESMRTLKNNRKRKTKKQDSANNDRNQGIVIYDSGASPSLRKNRCQHHLIDHADCPHCNNPTCPKIKNRYTGEEMDFLQYMRLWGLDVSDIAKQVGIGAQELLEMMNPSFI